MLHTDSVCQSNTRRDAHSLGTALRSCRDVIILGALVLGLTATAAAAVCVIAIARRADTLPQLGVLVPAPRQDRAILAHDCHVAIATGDAHSLGACTSVLHGHSQHSSLVLCCRSGVELCLASSSLGLRDGRRLLLLLPTLLNGGNALGSCRRPRRHGCVCLLRWCAASRCRAGELGLHATRRGVT